MHNFEQPVTCCRVTLFTKRKAACSWTFPDGTLPTQRLLYVVSHHAVLAVTTVVGSSSQEQLPPKQPT